MSVFLFALSLFSNYQIVERNKLNYEVLNVYKSNDNIVIEGWATMPSTQHFKGQETHTYTMRLVSQSTSFEVQGTLKNDDLSEQMSYRGHPKCNNSVLNSLNCNYDHKNVGFRFEIPLNRFEVNSDYKIYLKMNAKQSHKSYEIPLFYLTEGETQFSYQQKDFIIQSDFRHTRLQVFASDLVARSGPSPLSDYINLGKSCSYNYGNSLYMMQNSQFNHIYDINYYNDKITYFKVGVKAYGCVNNRMRAIESKDSSIYAHIPSTHVNYMGNPMIIRVRQKESIPKLFAEHIEINQYEDYDPFFKVSALDAFDGNITDNIELLSSNVNTRIPGNYQSCYQVSNSFNKTTNGCRFVKVIPIPSKRRFISKYTAHDTQLKRWNRTELREKMSNEYFIKKESFKN